MIIVNQTDVARTFFFDGVLLNIPPNGESEDILLTESNIRSIMISSKPSEVKFKITAHGVDDVALAKLGANPEYIYKEEKKSNNKK